MENKNNIIGKNIAFIHIPRTAGTYFTSYITNFLIKNEYKIINSWKNLKRDWTKKELLSFLEIKNNQPIFVHNHLGNWDKETIKKYKENGWFLVSFIRHPGDRLCSEYFYFEHPDEWNVNLDKYIKNMSQMERKGSRIPGYWKEFDYVAEFNKKNITFFFKKYFNHKYVPMNHLNISQNKGYNYYLSKNKISKDTRKILESSDEFKKYIEIKDKKFLRDEYFKLKKLIQKIFDTLLPKKPL